MLKKMNQGVTMFLVAATQVLPSVSQAAQLTCINAETKEQVLWIADDQGTISAGGEYVNPTGTTCKINDALDSDYQYVYGESLKAVAYCTPDSKILISVVKDENLSKNGSTVMLGSSVLVQKRFLKTLAKLICSE